MTFYKDIAHWRSCNRCVWFLGSLPCYVAHTTDAWPWPSSIQSCVLPTLCSAWLVLTSELKGRTVLWRHEKMSFVADLRICNRKTQTLLKVLGVFTCHTSDIFHYIAVCRKLLYGWFRIFFFPTAIPQVPTGGISSRTEYLFIHPRQTSTIVTTCV